MTDRSLKKSPSGKRNLPTDFVVGDSDENLDLFSLNRCEDNPVTSLDVLFKQGRHSFEKPKVAKPELDDDKKHENDPLCTVPEVPLGTLSRLVLEARNVTFKLQSTTRTGSKNETEPSSKPTRSNSTIRPSNIPSIRPTNIPSIRPSNIPTIRSSSVPKNTTSTSASASTSASTPQRTVSRSLTPLSRKTPSRSPTPTISKTTTSISKATSTTPSFKRAGDAQRSRSLTPRSKPLITEPSAPVLSSKIRVRSVSASSRDGNTSVSAKPRTPPKLKERVTLAFGKPVGTTGNIVNSPKRNTSPVVTRTRPKGPSPSSSSSSSSSSLIPGFSGVSHTAAATLKSVKSSATVADSTRSGRKVSKASVPMDVARNVKVTPQPFSSTMLYPHSIRTSSSRLRKRPASEGSSSSNQEEEEGKSLTKEENTEKKDSARYEELLNVQDVKDTNWLLSTDDESHFSLIFDNAFDSPPDLFPSL